MAKIELLAPAGGLESLRAASDFGADAVYAAGKAYGMRAFAENFTQDGIKRAADLLHGAGKKLYVALNAVFHQNDFLGLDEYIAFLGEAGADAFIISDPGVLRAAKRAAPGVPVHISTQQSTSNSHSAKFWHENGASRVILARELSLDDIADIRAKTPKALELEAFVHGAMCVAYSGRCLLSGVLTGRSGNKGECAQPCRWKYYLYEKGCEGEYLPVYSDDKGTYVLNSKDLCMIEHLKKIIDAGVTSLKIEGRMKSAYYVACVTRAYRKALDDVIADIPFDESLLDEVSKAGSRSFTTGFYFGNPRECGQDAKLGAAVRTHDFVGVVKQPSDGGGWALVQQRGKFCTGDILEALSPGGCGGFVVSGIRSKTGEPRESAPHPMEAVYIKCDYNLLAGDMLRKKNE